MANLSKTTQDHEEIRRWAEERGGKPSHVKSTESGDDVGIIRIDFPGYSGEGSLEEITWEEFFEKFDDNDLALIYQEETADGERSNFNKLVKAETADLPEKKSSGKSQGSSRSSKAASNASGGDDEEEDEEIEVEDGGEEDELDIEERPARKTASKRSSPVKKTASKGTKSAAKKGTPQRKQAQPH